MDAGLEAELSPPLRLALAWAPRHARPATLALFALDTRLAGFLRRGTEPLPVQMRLAWWRDTLGAPPSAWPRGDPLLDELRTWAAPEGLVALVDGWEGLLAETLDREAITGFALGREQAWSALAREGGATRAEPAAAARAWALADLAANLSAPAERRRVIETAGVPRAPRGWPRGRPAPMRAQPLRAPRAPPRPRAPGPTMLARALGQSP